MKNCIRIFLLFIGAMFLSQYVSSAYAAILPPYLIGGTVTVDNVLITQATDTGLVIRVTKLDGTNFTPVAEDNNGLTASNIYLIDVPIANANQPGGAATGDTAVIHVYLDGIELTVNSPANGQFTVGGSGSVLQINLAAGVNPVIAQQPMSGPPGTTFVEWGTGFTPNSTATLHFKKPNGTEYPTLQQPIDAIGHFEISYTAPMDKPPGTYTWWGIDGVTGAKSNEVSYQITALSTELTVQPVNPQTSESFYNNFFPNPDPDDLTTGGKLSYVIAADGQSRLLLRLIANSNPGQVTISVQGDIQQNGTISSLADHVNDPSTASIPVQFQQYGSHWIGFAVYRAPIDFSISGYENKLVRPVNLDVTYAGGNTALNLTLRRPPILISHGLWSYVWGNVAIEGFRNTLWERFTDRGGLNIADYIWLNDCFHENAREVNAGRDKTRINIQEYLAFVRSHGDTVTQVDYLGHSMGGQWGRLVEQKFSKDTFTYDNGYFHKLITLDTPHGGSFIADIGQFLLDNAAYISMPGEQSVRDYICWITAEFQSPVCRGAIEDLTSAGSIENLKEILVPSHAIMGNTPIDTACYLLSASEWATGYSVVKFIKLAEKLLKRINPEYGCENWFNQFDFTTNTDFVVDVHSQEGGLSGSQLNEYEHQHTGSFSSDVNACFFGLLNKGVNDSAFASGFPATHTWWNNKNFMSLMAETNPSATLKNAEPLGEIQFISPVDGTTIQPGQQVTVTLTTTGSLTLVNVMIMAAGSDTIELTQAPFTTALTVPDDAYDSFVIPVLGEGSDGNLYQASVTLVVNNDAVLQKVDVNPQSIYLDMGTQLKLTVIGTYSDGTIRDLSSGSKGTTYTAGDESILSVSADGVITPKSIGLGFVQVSPASADPVIVRVEIAVSDTEPSMIGLFGPGWNLISLPQQPSDTAIANVLSGISGKYASAWAFQNASWKVYDPANPDFSDLSIMEAGWGYWLNMTEPATLSVTGATPSASMNLITGWNLVGYNSSTAIGIADALSSITGNVISVWAYMNDAWLVYDPANPDFSDLTGMIPGYGYWINTNGACTWTLP